MRLKKYRVLLPPSVGPFPFLHTYHNFNIRDFFLAFYVSVVYYFVCPFVVLLSSGLTRLNHRRFLKSFLSFTMKIYYYRCGRVCWCWWLNTQLLVCVGYGRLLNNQILDFWLYRNSIKNESGLLLALIFLLISENGKSLLRYSESVRITNFPVNT